MIFDFITKLFKRKPKYHTYYTFDNDLPEDEIAQNRETILELLRGTSRSGIEKVIKFMEKHDFFNIPSSIHHHHNYKGGLAQHVLSVYNRALRLDPNLDRNSLVIVCIFHDLCKADLWYYDKLGGLHRNHGKSQRRGSKSIKILKDLNFKLTEDERLAIRWHMGGNNAHSNEGEEVNRARKNPLWKALYRANRDDSNQ